jgi:cytochrome P450
MGVLPSILARKGYRARAKLADVMVPYYTAGHYQGEAVSALVKERARLFLEWDMPVDEMAKQELAVMANGVANTVPTLFWMAFHIFSRPELDLVERLRTEVCRHIAMLRDTNGETSPAGAKVITIKYSTIMDTCPLLASCFREGARLATPNMTLRQVLADTVLSGDNGQTWLLKEGNMVVLPGEFLHRDKAIWGVDADEFNPDRFLPDPARNKETDRLRTISYVPFGGGKHLCPGRRFALAETLSFMAALVLGFEIEGLDPKKIRIQWPLMAQASRPVPGYEGGRVTVGRRKGWEHVEWKFEA